MDVKLDLWGPYLRVIIDCSKHPLMAVRTDPKHRTVQSISILSRPMDHCYIIIVIVRHSS